MPVVERLIGGALPLYLAGSGMLVRVLPLDPAAPMRRQVLLGAVGAPLLLIIGGCTDQPAVEVAPDPDRQTLEATEEIEAETLSALAGWSDGADNSAVSRDEARSVISAHIAALATALSAPPSTAPSSSESESYELVPTLSTAQAVAALDSAADEHTRALRSASAEISPLIASIAASDAALAAAIRRST